MKKFLTIVLMATLLAVGGCQKFDESKIWDTLFDLKVEQQQQAGADATIKN